MGKLYADVPQTYSVITVRNDAPGLKNLRITVNGQRFQVEGLKDNEIRYIHVQSAMANGNDNTIILTALGKPGTSASVGIGY